MELANEGKKNIANPMETVDMFRLKFPWPHQRVERNKVDQLIKFVDAIPD